MGKVRTFKLYIKNIAITCFINERNRIGNGITFAYVYM